jgi:hypothetical protein
MAIIKPLPNVPLTLSLANPNAEEVKGQYGIQFKYRLDGGNLIYLPPLAHAEIQALHAGPGEPFTLLKTIGQGNAANWKVEWIVQPDGPPPPRFDRPAPASVTREQPKSITKSPVAVMPAAGPTPSTPQSRTLANQLIAAIAAVKVARAYADQQGVPFEPTSRDICALAITGGIQVFKEGVY